MLLEQAEPGYGQQPRPESKSPQFCQTWFNRVLSHPPGTFGSSVEGYIVVSFSRSRKVIKAVLLLALRFASLEGREALRQRDLV